MWCIMQFMEYLNRIKFTNIPIIFKDFKKKILQKINNILIGDC